MEDSDKIEEYLGYDIHEVYTDTISISSNNGIILDSCYNMQSIVYKVIPLN